MLIKKGVKMKFNAIKYTMDNLMRDWYTSYTAGIGPDLDDTRIKKWLYQGTSDDYVISRMKSDYKGSAYFKHLPYDKSQDVRYTDNDGFVRLKDSVFSDDNIMNYRLGMYSSVMGWSHNGMDSDTAWNHYKFLTSKNYSDQCVSTQLTDTSFGKYFGFDSKYISKQNKWKALRAILDLYNVDYKGKWTANPSNDDVNSIQYGKGKKLYSITIKHDDCTYVINNFDRIVVSCVIDTDGDLTKYLDIAIFGVGYCNTGTWADDKPSFVDCIPLNISRSSL